MEQKTKDWTEYPVGTKAFDVNGGHWTKTECGWNWPGGSTFPTPGASAIGVEMPKEYRVVFNPTMSANISAFVEYFDAQYQAEAALQVIANYTLYLHEAQLMHDHSNFGLVLKLVNNEWIEIDSDGGFI